VPECALDCRIVSYTAETLASVCKDAPENGFSFIIMPAGSPAHTAYAQDASQYDETYLKPVVGWISGALLSQIGHKRPKVFSGLTNEDSSECAVVMHITLPAGKHAELDIVNVFKRGAGDTIKFQCSGFNASECLINGKPANFAEYMLSIRADSRLPAPVFAGG